MPDENEDMFSAELEGDGAPTTTIETPEGEGDAPTPQAKSAGSNDAMLEALREISGKLNKPSEGAAPKELSKEEKEELWGVWNPTKTNPKFFREFFGLGEDVDDAAVTQRQALFSQMHEGLMRQVFTGVMHLLKERDERYDSEYAPIREHIAEQRAQKTRSDFNTAYPVFADGKYDKVLKIAASELASSGVQHKTSAEYFKALAESAAESIKAILPDFDLGAAPTTTKKAPGSTPKLPRTSVGGSGGIRSGSTTPSSGKPSGDQSDEIFE